MTGRQILMFSLLIFSLYSYGQKEIEVCYYTSVEEMPLFNGAQNLRESLKLLDDYIEGRVNMEKTSSKGTVRLSFVIDPMGNPVEIEILNGVNPTLDSLASNYLKEMGKWKPGRVRGEAVYVRENVAVKFE